VGSVGVVEGEVAAFGLAAEEEAVSDRVGAGENVADGVAVVTVFCAGDAGCEGVFAAGRFPIGWTGAGDVVAGAPATFSGEAGRRVVVAGCAAGAEVKRGAVAGADGSLTGGWAAREAGVAAAGCGAAAEAGVSFAGGWAVAPVEGGATLASPRMSEVRLRGGGFVAGALVTAAGAAGLVERVVATTAAPAASSAAPVSPVEERLAGADEAGTEVAGDCTAGAAGGVPAAGLLVSGGSGAVAGRFKLLAESFCEGRGPGFVEALDGVGALIEAVGAGEGASVRDMVAGRGGMLGGCEMEAAAPGCVPVVADNG
jgi:hypothetical protein